MDSLQEILLLVSKRKYTTSPGALATLESELLTPVIRMNQQEAGNPIETFLVARIRNPILKLLMAILFFHGWFLLNTIFADSIGPPGLISCQLSGSDDVPIEAACGDLSLPENHGYPDGKKITIPLVIVRASQPAGRPPLVLLQGGPGASNIWQKPFGWMFRDQDLIMLGYRGADGSPILYCPDLAKAQLGVGGNLLSSHSIKLFAEAVGQCAEDLEAGGTNLKNFTMIEVIEDFETVRKRLDIDQFNLLSESYGTRLAQIYSWKYPDSIARSVMIGVNPPGHFVWEPDLIDEQIRYVSGLCARDSQCSSRTEDFTESMRRVMRDMPDSWLGFPIDPGMVRFIGINLMYHANSAAMLYDTILAADNGDASGLALITLLYKLQIRLGDTQPFGDLFSKGMVDFEPSRDYAREMNPPLSIMGSPMSELLMAAGPDWPAADFPEEYRQVQTTEVETLLINGSVDFSTPVQNGRNELLPFLKNGHLVELKEQGHVSDIYKLQPEAAEHLILEYLHDGRIDPSRFTEQPLNFTPDFGFPLIMKAAVMAVILLVLLLVGSFLYWRRRRRMSLAGAG